MIEEFKSVFGDYKNNNTNLFIELIQKINQYVLPYIDYEKPYTKGNFNFEYFDYLKDKKLNVKPQSENKVFEEIAFLFQNIPNWGNPGTMLNIIPPINIASLAVSSYASLFNPNFSQDRYAGLLLTTELEVVKYISDLVEWEWKQSHGLFTFGGKGTNLYSTKIALNRAYPQGKKEGYGKNDFFIVTSKKGHPCHKEVADWLGIGSDSCIGINCNEKGEMLLTEAEDIICSYIEQGKIFLGFNLTGGSTVEFEIDPIKEVSLLRDKIKAKYNLKYSPLIHIDSVIVWVWLFFKCYDFEKNSLNIENEILNKIGFLTHRISQLKYADSFGIDFHKSGFCPAISSLFIVKDRADIYNLGQSKTLEIEDLRFGNFSPFESSLELSRSSSGAISALVALKTFGIEGFQKAIIQLMSCSEFFRNELQKIDFVEVLNNYSNGFATLLIFKPQEYKNLKLEDILKLPQKDTDIIKDYNLSYALYVEGLNNQHKISFTLTASDVFNVNNTNVCLGTQKAFPMSLFATKEKVKQIIDEMVETKKKFDEEGCIILKKITNAPVDMVYRK